MLYYWVFGIHQKTMSITKLILVEQTKTSKPALAYQKEHKAIPYVETICMYNLGFPNK